MKMSALRAVLRGICAARVRFLMKTVRCIVNSLDDHIPVGTYHNLQVSDRVPSFLEIFFSRNKFYFQKNVARKHRWKFFACKVTMHRYTWFDEFLQFARNDYREGDVAFLCDSVLADITRFGAGHFPGKFHFFMVNALQPTLNKNAKWVRLYLMFMMGMLRVREDVRITVVLEDATNRIVFRLIHSIFPSAKIINRFVNEPTELRNFTNISVIRKLLGYCRDHDIGLQCYSKKTAFEYGIEYLPNFYDADVIRERQAAITPDNSVFFIGVCSEQRAPFIFSLAQILLLNGIRINFYLFGMSEENMRRCRKINEEYGDEYIHINEYMEFDGYIDAMLRSGTMIDFYRVRSNEGYSFRTAEALFAGKKLITNRPHIREEDFFDERFIFILDRYGRESHEDLAGRFLSFVRSTEKPEYKNTEIFDLKYWMEKSGIT